ncbi:MAG: trypsin-like peptidase domain-containing protein, partial [Pseudomonadota bacterium]
TTQCGVSSAPLAEWTSYRCDEVLASEPFISCDAGPGDLDFTLASVIGDPASQHGFVPVATTPLQSGDEIYIVQHPAGRPQEIAVGSGSDVVVDGSVLRYYGTLDTEGGSSGSPVIRASDNALIGLHHCGGCSSPGVGNRGMLMTDIAPLIQPFLCSDGADLRATRASAPVEISGNGDGVLDPGERWGFSVSVLNNSCGADASNVSVNVAVGSGNATLVSDSAGLGSLAAGASATSVPFAFDVPVDAVCGETVTFDVTSVTSSDGTFAGAADIASLTSGNSAPDIIASESFDSGLAAWTVTDGGSGGGAAATWTLDNPGGRAIPMTAPFAIVDSDEAGTSAPMDEILASSVFDASGYSGVTLSFMHDFNHYVAGQDEKADVDIRSSATEGEWVNIARYQGGDTSGTVQIDITSYAADDLEIRFHYYDAEYEWWWAVDDIAILGSTPVQCNVFSNNDTDGDNVDDSVDNCTLVSNADQIDADGDGYGNLCDADLNNDGVVNVLDLGILRTRFFSADPVADFNNDGVVNLVDLGLMRQQFFGSPGPSANAP